MALDRQIVAGNPLLDGLALQADGHDRFVGMVSPVNGWARVFGGAIAAQALMAAYSTVPDRLCHSLHAYFLASGDPARPIHYVVTRLRDGGSFTLRQIDILQGESRLAFVTASFQRQTEGLAHQALKASDTPPPDAFDDSDRRGWRAGILLRNVDGLRAIPGRDPSIHRVWCRSDACLGDDQRMHQIALTYATDFTLLPAILKPHDMTMETKGTIFASLDHGLWFHRPMDFGEWLLCDIRAHVSGGERGLATGGVFTRDGTLVATLAQEGFLRSRV